MTKDANTSLRPVRRTVLKTVAGVGFAGALGSESALAQSAERVAWEFKPREDIDSSPTVIDGTVYIGSSTGLHAVDTETGNQEWVSEKGPVLSAPHVVDGTAFVGCFDYNLYAVDAETGEDLWAFETGNSIISSPTVVDGTVILGSEDTVFYAVNAETGEEEWVFKTDDRIRSSATVVDGTIYFGSMDGNLYAVDAETGEEEWTFDTGGEVESSPTVADETVFVSSDSGGGIYAVDANTGTQQWRAHTSGSISSPTVAGDTLFVGGISNKLYAFNTDDGNQRWTFNTGDDLYLSPTVVGNTVFLGNSSGNFYALETETGEQKWIHKTGQAIESSPTVVDGTIFFGTKEDPTSFPNESKLMALDADVTSSSEDSRVRLGTLGHHHVWADRSSGEDDSPESPSVSFERAAAGDRKPVDPWFVERSNGTHEIRAERATVGSQSLYIDGGDDLDNVAVGVPVDLSEVAQIKTDVYIVRGSISFGDLALHIDKIAENKIIPINGRTDDGRGRFTGLTGDVSSFTGIHDLFVRARGSNEAYFDNIRFYDGDGTLIPPTEVISSESKEEESEDGKQIELPFAERFEDGLNGWTVDQRFRLPRGPNPGEGGYSEKYDGSARLHVDGGPSTIGVGHETTGIEAGTTITATTEVETRFPQPGNISVAVFAPDGDDNHDARSSNDGDVTSGETVVSLTLEESYPAGSEIRVWSDVWPGEFTTYVTEITATPPEPPEPPEAPESSPYTDSEGYVDSEGLLDAGADYRNGEIGEDRLNEVASAFRSGEPLS